MAGHQIAVRPENGSQALTAPGSSTQTQMGAAVAEARGRQMMAKDYPRDEFKASAQMVRTCQNARFASLSLYSYRRGGAPIEGQTIKFAREAARAWGNIAHGMRILERDEDWCTVQGYAFDLESNVIVTQETRFQMRIQRRNKRTGETEWITPDERDARERINSMASRVERNCILAVIPEHVRSEWEDAVRDTMAKAASGDLKSDRETALRSMVAAFGAFGIPLERIESALGHPIAEVIPEELAALRRTYAGIKAGETTPDDAFPREQAAPPEEPPVDPDSYMGTPPGSTLEDQMRQSVDKGAQGGIPFEGDPAQSTPEEQVETKKRGKRK